MRFDSEWVQDTGVILGKNRKRAWCRSFIIVLGYALFVALVILGQPTGGAIVFIISLISAIILIPKNVRVAFSEILAYNLSNIFINIEKYNGKNKHFQEECFNYLEDMGSEIDKYVKRKGRAFKMDFDYEKIISSLKKLRNQNEKVVSFFLDYEKNKKIKEDLKEIYRKLAVLFHVREEFPSEAHTEIDKLEKLEIEPHKTKYGLKRTFKRYLIENKLWVLIIFCSVFVAVVWLINITFELKLVITIPVVGTAIAQFLFSPKSREKRIDNE